MGHQTGNQAPDYLSLTEAHPDSVFWMTQDIRDEEFEEVLVVGDQHLSDAWKAPQIISMMMQSSDGCMMIHGGPDDSILGIFGFGQWPEEGPGEDPEPHGYIWFIPSKTLMKKHLLALTRQMRRHVLPHMLVVYPSIGNYIMERNTEIIRWMRMAGFKSKRVIQENGHAFRLMVLRRTQ